MKRLTIIVVLGASVILAGCAAAEDEAGTVRERTVVLEDGRTVTCLTWKFLNAGGMSCDWDAATQTP